MREAGNFYFGREKGGRRRRSIGQMMR